MRHHICTVEGCERKHKAHGYCEMHWRRVKKHGSPDAPDSPTAIRNRFWQKVDQTPSCWFWTGCLDRKGYGWFGLKGRVQRTHRVSYELANGPIPKGMQVDHTCYNRNCVNPDHLRLVTHKQNQENRQGARVDCTSGVRGVYFCKSTGRYHARVRHNRQDVYIGSFKALAAAEAAVIAKRNELFSHNDQDRRTA